MVTKNHNSIGWDTIVNVPSFFLLRIQDIHQIYLGSCPGHHKICHLRYKVFDLHKLCSWGCHSGSHLTCQYTEETEHKPNLWSKRKDHLFLVFIFIVIAITNSVTKHPVWHAALNSNKKLQETLQGQRIDIIVIRLTTVMCI